MPSLSPLQKNIIVQKNYLYKKKSFHRKRLKQSLEGNLIKKVKHESIINGAEYCHVRNFIRRQGTLNFFGGQRLVE